MHYLITGHTGFKGGWLSLLLKAKGHTVSGISLDPLPRSIYTEANLAETYEVDGRCDIRDSKKLQENVRDIEADVIVHLAAQALVRDSYKDPIGTFETNVLGTLNLLESAHKSSTTKATLIITTDKVYKNINKINGYIETDSLGGDDPYSASKAAADIAAQSWIKNFSNHPVAIARAGNVIGAGDWAKDRLIPDLIKSIESKTEPVLRYPNAIRPWQHVLDCLNGYLTLIDSVLENGTQGEWNFGPAIESDKTVAKVADTVIDALGSNLGWIQDSGNFPKESNYLLLDSSKARSILGWEEKLDFNESINWTVAGYKAILNGTNSRKLMEQQIEHYLSL